MKKIISFILVLSLLLSISVVCFADNGNPPIAVQAAVPSDFHFDHTETGSTRVDALTESLVNLTVSAVFSGMAGATAVGFIVGVSQALAEYYTTQRTLSGRYIKYVYVPNDRGAYPACDSWVYVEYYADVNLDYTNELIGTDSYVVPIVLPK